MNNLKTYNWGIIGPGRIAGKFVEGLKILPNARLYAVASRSLERAESFRALHGFEKSFGSYAEMLADVDLDIVYIATTNNLHFEHTMISLDAGKAVLCEKPLALNRNQAEQMIFQARKKNVFLMEALCSRFMPSMLEMNRQIENGATGKPIMLQCDFGFIAPFDAENRIYAPELGGGSIPDIGIYPIFTALYLFGKPTEIQVVSIPAPAGTDWTTAMLFKHKGGEISMLSSSFQVSLKNEARVYCENGYLKLHKLFSKTACLSFYNNDGDETVITSSITGNGYNYEAAEVMKCLDEKRAESPLMSHQLSLDLISLTDEVIFKCVPA
ncbi:MAG: Gfo/Idh/MocA family oxidoreductase [Dysgonamonadaceae bacterium]|jgi:predicted dehydrogenase|nr:Gfo/Idh/MocA family oxidoreductase [Dysgonamonadaceae bacterium]